MFIILVTNLRHITGIAKAKRLRIPTILISTASFEKAGPILCCIHRPVVIKSFTYLGCNISYEDEKDIQVT